MDMCPVYGGPLKGSEAKRAPLLWTRRDDDRTEDQRFIYRLVTDDHAQSSFVPAAHDDLLRAYDETDREPGNPAGDALRAEINHRNLEC